MHEVRSIGSRLELFVDDYLIDSLKGVSLQLQRPQHAGIAVAFDERWEGLFSGCITTIKDGDRSVLEALGMVLSWEVTGIHFETPLTQGPMTMAERERIFGKPKATTRKKGKKKKGAAAGPLYYKRSY